MRATRRRESQIAKHVCMSQVAKHVCMSQSPKHVCMYVCLEPPVVPPLTNLKKLNYRSNTERFS